MSSLFLFFIGFRFLSKLLVCSESSLAPLWCCWGKHGCLHFISGWVSSLASDWLNLWSQHTLSCVLLLCNKGPWLFLEVREIPLKLSKTLVLVHAQYHSHIYQLDHNPVACTLQLEKPDWAPLHWLVFSLWAALTWTPLLGVSIPCGKSLPRTLAAFLVLEYAWMCWDTAVLSHSAPGTQLGMCLLLPDEVRNVFHFYLFVLCGVFCWVFFFFSLSHSSLPPWFNQKAGKHTFLCQQKVLSARGMAEKQRN